MNRLVGYLAALTLTGTALAATTSFVTDAEHTVAVSSIKIAVDAARNTALLDDGDMVAAVREQIDGDEHLAFDGTTLRWTHGDICEQTVVGGVWDRGIVVEDCSL